MSTVSSWRWRSSLPHPLFPPSSSTSNNQLVSCRATSDPVTSSHGNSKAKMKVVDVGSGWAGLAASHHLSKQGLGVTVLETACSAEVGVHGFWYPYQNIFSLVDELTIRPFTNWPESAFYSSEGIEVDLLIYHNLPKLPAPFGAFFYTQFSRLPLFDRLTAFLPLDAVIDFENTDASWRKYDSMTKFSIRLFTLVYLLLLSNALYYFIRAHQQDLDFVWCRGKVVEKIFRPWLKVIKSNNGVFIDKNMVADFSIDEDAGSISEVCGKEKYPADAVVLAVGVCTLQNIIQSRQGRSS